MANLLLNASRYGVLRSPMFSNKYAWFKGPAFVPSEGKKISTYETSGNTHDVNAIEVRVGGTPSKPPAEVRWRGSEDLEKAKILLSLQILYHESNLPSQNSPRGSRCDKLVVSRIQVIATYEALYIPLAIF